MRDNFSNLAVLPETDKFQALNLVIVIHLKGVTWDCSKEGWKLLPITQTGTCGKITHL